MELPGMSTFGMGVDIGYMILKQACFHVGVSVPITHGHVLSNWDGSNGMIATADALKKDKPDPGKVHFV